MFEFFLILAVKIY